MRVLLDFISVHKCRISSMLETAVEACNLLDFSVRRKYNVMPETAVREACNLLEFSVGQKYHNAVDYAFVRSQGLWAFQLIIVYSSVFVHMCILAYFMILVNLKC